MNLNENLEPTDSAQKSLFSQLKVNQFQDFKIQIKRPKVD